MTNLTCKDCRHGQNINNRVICNHTSNNDIEVNPSIANWCEYYTNNKLTDLQKKILNSTIGNYLKSDEELEAKENERKYPKIIKEGIKHAKR